MTEADLHLQRTDRFDLRALYETSRILSSSLDLEFVLNNLLLTAMSKLLVTRGAALVFDPVQDAYRAAVVKGLRDIEKDSWLKMSDVQLGEVMQDNLPDKGVPEALQGHGLSLVISVAHGDRNMGLVALGPKMGGAAFENREVEFFHSLVNMSSAGVHNSLMVDELQIANRDLDSKVQQLNTLFDISQEFNATVDRERLVKLLTFALMGQMLVNKHLFLLGSEGDESVDGTVDGKAFRIVTKKGIGSDALPPEMLNELCSLKELYLLDDEVPEEWKPFAERGLVIALPIRQKNETCGVLCLGPKMTGQPYQPDEVEFLYALGNLAFVSLQNSYLVDQQIEKERLEEEMRLARQIQEGLQPSAIPEVEGIELASMALPSRHVAGDYYDLVRLDDARMLIAIADVTGKGVPASLLMSNLQAALHSLTSIDINLEDSTANINRVICQNTGYDKFITYFHGIYNESDRTFQYVNAGHNPPMLLRGTGELDLLEKGGLLLGVMKGMPYESETVQLHPGDLVAMFTDGVTEAMSPDGEEFEEHRLEALLRQVQHKSAPEILDAIREAITVWSDGDPTKADDVTIIVVKVKEESAQ